ncbi:von Willebrand factor type A domain-containing protein [Pseudomonadota bacterium AL_CKDN230030165-1A_HGKHYDSX7]
MSHPNRRAARFMPRVICAFTSLALLAACTPSRDADGSGAKTPDAATQGTVMPGTAAPNVTPPAADSTVARTTRPEPQALVEPSTLDAPPPPPHPHPATTPARESYAGTTARRMVPAPAPGSYLPPAAQESRDRYSKYTENPVRITREAPLATFGVDVDTGSYTHVRRMLSMGKLPPADAVRAEEFINYFDYGYTPPANRDVPFSITTELAPAPWNPKRQLLMVGIQGWRAEPSAMPPANLVLLVDTSGSMAGPDRLPLIQAAMRQLVGQLRAQDRVAIVTYAGSAGVALPSTPGDKKAEILAAIDALRAAGSTNGSAGLELAYNEAARGFIDKGVNRILLASDGDFNVNTTDIDALKERISVQRKRGIGLTTLGVGSGNFNEALAQQLANSGNGSYHYLDNLQEARRVLVSQIGATLYTIAKDAKVQVEFNPAFVAEYRLIGYEKRALASEDFNNDQVDAGEIGAGASVTALFEITPVGSDAPSVDPLRYGDPKGSADTGSSANELAMVKVRYQRPEGGPSQLVSRPVPTRADAAPSDRLSQAAAAGAFAQWLRGGKYLAGYTPADIAAQIRQHRPNAGQSALADLVDVAGSLGTPAQR